jgi:nucleoid-associated protein YgaU
MRILGNIERFLVLGIVVVIGTILVVAITGARDLENERKDVLAATKDGGKKNNPALKVPSEVGRTGRTSGGGAAVDPRPSVTDPAIIDAIHQQIDAHKGVTGEVPPATPPAPIEQSPGGNVAPAPDGVEPPISPAPKPDAEKPADPPEPVPVTDAPKAWVYEVQPYDTLERIARAIYGDGRLWKDIQAANPSLSDAHKIKPGDKLNLPKAPTVESRFVKLAEGAGIPPPATAAPNASPAPNATPEKTASGGFKRVTTADEYKVQKGDTLMSIAAANYGTKAAWRVILDANSSKLADKDSLKVGTVLKLPAN